MGIPDYYRLNRITGDESAELEGNKNFPISRGSFREQQQTRKLIARSFSLYLHPWKHIAYQIQTKHLNPFQQQTSPQIMKNGVWTNLVEKVNPNFIKQATENLYLDFMHRVLPWCLRESIHIYHLGKFKNNFFGKFKLDNKNKHQHVYWVSCLPALLW